MTETSGCSRRTAAAVPSSEPLSTTTTGPPARPLSGARLASRRSRRLRVTTTVVTRAVIDLVCTRPRAVHSPDGVAARSGAAGLAEILVLAVGLRLDLEGRVVDTEVLGDAV